VYCAPDTAFQEICILAVVISGLSVLSVGQFASGPPPTRENSAYLSDVGARNRIVTCRGNSLRARFQSLGGGLKMWPYLVLAVALASSLGLALQEAISQGRSPAKLAGEVG